jgi:SsrA-binding protein
MEKKKVFQPIVNKKALFDYEVMDSLEAGIELTGAEVKSIRLGQASLKESHVVLTQSRIGFIECDHYSI